MSSGFFRYLGAACKSTLYICPKRMKFVAYLLPSRVCRVSNAPPIVTPFAAALSMSISTVYCGNLALKIVKALSIYPIGSFVRLEGGEFARVVRSQPEIPEKPVIAVIADAQRNILRFPVEIDLAMTEPTPPFEPVPSPI